MKEVIADPRGVARRIADDSDLFYISSAKVVETSRRRVRMNVRFEPWPPMAAAGYPRERIRLEIRSNGDVRAYPIRATNRSWEHRFPGGGPLCLYYPHDPGAIVWSAESGTFEGLLGIISRHLQAEEYFRRHGTWPWEDAPHGLGASAGPQSRMMRDLAGVEEE